MNFDKRLAEIQLTSAQRMEAAAALARADAVADALIGATRSLRRAWRALLQSIGAARRHPAARKQGNWAGRPSRVGASLDD